MKTKYEKIDFFLLLIHGALSCVHVYIILNINKIKIPSEIVVVGRSRNFGKVMVLRKKLIIERKKERKDYVDTIPNRV